MTTMGSLVTVCHAPVCAVKSGRDALCRRGRVCHPLRAMLFRSRRQLCGRRLCELACSIFTTRRSAPTRVRAIDFQRLRRFRQLVSAAIGAAWRIVLASGLSCPRRHAT